jgi:hypothetical protein
MSVLDRLFPWPHGLLPRRAAVMRPAVPVATADRPAPAPAGPAASPPNVSQPEVADLEALGERRARALRAMFPMLFSMCARRSDLWQAIAIERYLAQASNTADLEQRIREVQSRRQFSWSE